jgi:UDP-N-acetylmuramoylalanine--D-glutamate ligase
MAACRAIGINNGAIVAGLREFTPLRHRFESLGTYWGRQWINDSKATTPASTSAAIQSCSSPPWVFLGGSNKGIDLRPLCEEIAHRIRGAALLGEAGAQLDALFAEIMPELPRRVCVSLREAVEWTAKSSTAGDTVLLSPACASFDWFQDYADRGDQFREEVQRLVDADLLRRIA